MILASAVPPQIGLYLLFKIRFLLYLPIIIPTQYALVLITLTQVSPVGPVLVTSLHLCALIPLGNQSDRFSLFIQNQFDLYLNRGLDSVLKV